VTINRVLGPIVHTWYRMEHAETVVCNSIEDSSLAHGGVQWSFGVFPLGRPLDIYFKHAIELRLPRIDEWMGEPQRAIHLSMSYIHRGCHQTWERENDTHIYSSRRYHDLLVIPLGLTNALFVVQSCRQWQRHLLIDAFIVHNMTWEVHLSHYYIWVDYSTIFFHLHAVCHFDSARPDVVCLMLTS
jgi:hypothetical protein